MTLLTISLPESTVDRLSALAERSGKTAEAFAAELLNAQVEDGEISRLRLEIVKLREDFALATEVLLVTGNKLDESDAREWVKQTIRNR